MARLTHLLLPGLGLLLAACGGGEQPAPPPPEVGVMTLKTESAEITNELPGRTSPFVIAEIRPQVTGIIRKRLFEEGAHVRQGQPLYQIDPAPYEAAVSRARAAVSRATANLGAIETRAKRTEKLVREQAVSAQEAEDTQASLGQARAEVEAARAELRTAEINLGYTKIAAPISGRIGRSAVTSGALVSANQAAPLSTVQTLDPIYVDITQSSNELLEIKQALLGGSLSGDRGKSARVRLILQDGTEYPLVGTLKFAEVAVDPSTGSVTLRAQFPNPQQILLPGMFVRARLVEAVDNAAILVPQGAVSRNERGRPIAYVVTDDNKAELRDLETRRAVGHRWLVTSGLKAGERLIVDGLQRVRPGIDVRPAAIDGEGGGTPAAAPAAGNRAAG